jgi:eukaryotic-like serine/threonine-protein kinase
MMTLDPLNIVGNALGDYEIVAFLGAGAFGFVYEALVTGTDTSVALKILSPNAVWQQLREFNNEADLLLKMTGARAVVDIFDTGDQTVNVVAGGIAQFAYRLRYHVLELAEGSLDELLTDLQDLDWPSRLGLFRDVVLGVHQMHQRRIVHRDLKAANCLLFPQGNGLAVKLSDLGRSRDLNERPGASPDEYTFGRGDPNFAPPEMLFGAAVDSAMCHRCADLHGIGSVFFELAVGQGITGIALFPHSAKVMAHRSLPDAQRRAQYQADLAEVRSWYEPAFDLFDAAIPKAIRQQGGQLLRQLCDPDPEKRLPRVALGKRAVRPDELCWLLRRTDILRLTLNNDIRQKQRLRSRKERVI